jgi:hypothetical protein
MMKTRISASDLFPPPQHGINAWIFGRASYLAKLGVEKTQAFKLINECGHTHAMRRPFKTGEISSALRTAYDGGTAKSAGGRRRRLVHQPLPSSGEWPAVMSPPALKADPKAIEKALAAGEPWSLEDAWEDSPLRVDECLPAQILSMLFQPQALLCIGSVTTFQVRPMHEWLKHGASGEQVVPSPNVKIAGRTKRGRLSGHCRNAVGARHYLVVEFDDENLNTDKQASLIRFLRDIGGGTLRMLMHSGGKSLHGWFEPQADESKTWDFFKVAVRLGADPRMWLPEQMARTPNSRRENGQWQKVYYFDPRK